MNDLQHKRLIKAADFFNKYSRPFLSGERGIHAETIIASVARMAGTMLFRSFVPPDNYFEPGTVVLSEQANEKGPRLMNLMFETLKQLGESVGEHTIKAEDVSTQSSQLTLKQTQELLDPMIIAYCKAESLSFEEAAFSLAIATGILIYDCRSTLEVQKGAGIAVYCLIEGSKTAPIPLICSKESTTPSTPEKKPWYKLW